MKTVSETSVSRTLSRNVTQFIGVDRTVEPAFWIIDGQESEQSYVDTDGFSLILKSADDHIESVQFRLIIA